MVAAAIRCNWRFEREGVWLLLPLIVLEVGKRSDAHSETIGDFA